MTIILLAFFLQDCGDARQEGISQNKNRELHPESVSSERSGYEAIQSLQSTGCLFLHPDTSLLSLKIRDINSGKAFIGDDKPGSQDEYRFYSNDFQQLLSLTQHPGDGKYQISLFRVEYAKKDDYGYRKLAVDTFQTEKGIRLGISKADIINKLGNCYAALDSTKEYIELYYRIEAPQDTQTNLLASHNMPVYYASYKIRNGRLEWFEFGFAYP